MSRQDADSDGALTEDEQENLGGKPDDVAQYGPRRSRDGVCAAWNWWSGRGRPVRTGSA
ncbi:hypothetical protein ACIRQF_31570 [Streptomyces sp. NPDC101191]|uniref:hypothetical protein n=1 Tax=Streptomyces sp. NPDC101191 TaxID=3366126 RepID=UPI00380A8593